MNMDWPKIFDGIRNRKEEDEHLLNNYFRPFIDKYIKSRCYSIEDEVLRSKLLRDIKDIVQRIILKGLQKIINNKLRYEPGFRNLIYDIANTEFEKMLNKKRTKKSGIIDESIILHDAIDDDENEEHIRIKQNVPRSLENDPLANLLQKERDQQIIDICNKKLNNLQRIILTKKSEGMRNKELSEYLRANNIASLSERQLISSFEYIRKKIADELGEDY